MFSGSHPVPSYFGKFQFPMSLFKLPKNVLLHYSTFGLLMQLKIKIHAHTYIYVMSLLLTQPF